MRPEDGSNTTNGPPPFMSRVERARRTRELLEAAAAASTLDQRHDLLTELAALNLDLVSAVTLATAKRYRGTPLDHEALLAHVTAVYTAHVLALESVPDRDFVIWATPIVRGAIVEFVRLVPAAS